MLAPWASQAPIFWAQKARLGPDQRKKARFALCAVRKSWASPGAL